MICPATMPASRRREPAKKTPQWRVQKADFGSWETAEFASEVDAIGWFLWLRKRHRIVRMLDPNGFVVPVDIEGSVEFSKEETT